MSGLRELFWPRDPDAADADIRARQELAHIRKARDFYRSQLAELDRREQELARLTKQR